MTLLRSAARTMLASYFVVSGLKAVRDPESLVPAAEPLVDGVVPQIQRFAPEQVSSYVPTDAKTWVRINGALELVGGLALASGKGRRLGAALLALSLVPTTIGKYPFWSRSDPAERAADRDHFLKNLSLLGGVLIASRDTEGKPSLGYRASKTGHQLASDTKKVQAKVSKETKELTDAALAEGALLVGAVVGTSRKGRKRAAKQLKAAKVTATKQAAEAKQAAAKAAKQARKDAGKFAKSASKDAGKQLEAAKKEAGKQLAAVKKSAAAFTENIQLGEN
ncbi:MAG TPA: DoxX family membrane protein [Microlunatus sp.]|nr:DoxX family membrane protein [Microlunatus sp.]